MTLKMLCRTNVLFAKLSVITRQKHLWTVDKVVKSPCKDIVIPNMTLVDYVWRNIDKWATRTAITCGITDRSYTYEELYKQSRAFATSLRKSFKLQDGDTVAIMLQNIPEYPSVAFGALAAGGIVTTINPLYTAHEIQRQLQLSEAKLIITTPEFASVVKESFSIMKKEVPIITVMGKTQDTVSFVEIVEDKNIDEQVLKEVKRNTEDVCFLPYSSGTTGLPKGVELSNRNIVTNCEQLNSDLRHHTPTTDTHQDVIFAVLPMFHSYALSMIMSHKLSAGLRLITLPSFQSKTFLAAMLKYKVNLLYAAPPMVLFLGSHPDVTADHMKYLKTIVSGAAPLPKADIEKVFRRAGRELNFIQAYGLTETSPLATTEKLGTKNYSSVGYAVPNVELRIIDENLNNLGPNEVGELLIKGPNVMKGYRNNSKANKEALLEGGWLRTGDIATIDEFGAVTITDRLKELIKVKGFQVPPAELEGVLKEHSDVLDAAVIGVPDEKTGEKPKAFIVTKPGCDLNEKAVMDFVNERVAPYKSIKEVKFVDNIPKNPSGKILRRVIKEMYS